MGIWSTLKQHAGSQFLEVIEWLDDTNDTLVYRYPVFNQKITDNSKLVVRESQASVFVAEGKLSDVFGPGTYTLDTRNTPIVSFFQSIFYKLNYPYKGDIYFTSTRQFTDNKWGTSSPFMMRDAEFGPVRVRAYGIFSYRITDPATFLRQLVGTDGLFTTDEINGQLKRKLVSVFADTVGKARIPVLDLAANYMDIGDKIRERMNPAFEESYGISLTDLTIENIGLPAAVEEALDNRTKMGVLGDLNAYTQLKAAESLEAAAKNPGIGGAGVGMGVGFGMGNMMGNAMAGGAGGGQFNPHAGMQGGPAPAPPPLPTDQRYHYAGAAGQQQLTLQEVVGQVVANRDGKHMLWMPGWPSWKSWSDVPEVAGQVPPPAAAPPPLAAEEEFHYHGPGGQGTKTTSEVANLVKSDPDGQHMVWQQGFDGWKPATEVPAIQAALSAGPPPPPPMGGPPPPPV